MPILRLVATYLVLILVVVGIFNRDKVVQIFTGDRPAAEAQAEAPQDPAQSAAPQPVTELAAPAAPAMPGYSTTAPAATPAAPAAPSGPVYPPSEEELFGDGPAPQPQPAAPAPQSAAPLEAPRPGNAQLQTPQAQGAAPPAPAAPAAAPATPAAPAPTRAEIIRESQPERLDDSAAAAINAARNAYWAGDAAGAVAQLEALQARLPNNADIPGEIGNIHYAQRNYSAAADAYVAAAEILVAQERGSQAMNLLPVLRQIAPDQAQALATRLQNR